MFHMTNNTCMYDVNWFTDGKCTFIEKCIVVVGNENFDQICDDDNSTCNKENKHTVTCVTPQRRDHITSHQNIGIMGLSIGTGMGCI